MDKVFFDRFIESILHGDSEHRKWLINEAKKFWKEMRMKPTIGRIVHYQRYGSPGGEHKPEPSPAIVTQVFENDECQLFVMNPNGTYFNRTPYSKDPKPGHWSWPPRAEG